MQVIAAIIIIPLLIAYFIVYGILSSSGDVVMLMLTRVFGEEAADIIVAVILGSIVVYGVREYIFGCLGCLGTIILIAILIAIF